MEHLPVGTNQPVAPHCVPLAQLPESHMLGNSERVSWMFLPLQSRSFLATVRSVHRHPGVVAISTWQGSKIPADPNFYETVCRLLGPHAARRVRTGFAQQSLARGDKMCRTPSAHKRVRVGGCLHKNGEVAVRCHLVLSPPVRGHTYYWMWSAKRDYTIRSRRVCGNEQCPTGDSCRALSLRWRKGLCFSA